MPRERTGSIYKSKNGDWFARVTFTVSNGKRRDVKRKAKDKTDAKDLLKRLLRQIEDEGENAIDAAQMTFKDLANYYEQFFLTEAKYIDGRKVSGLRDVSRAKGVLAHFRDYFGNKKLREITYGDVYNYRNIRLKSHTQNKKPRTLSTMNRELSVLKRIFNIGFREGWLLKNPMNCGETLIDVSAERKRERILTLEEEKRLLVACDERVITYTRGGKQITAIDNGENRKHLKPFLIALLDTGARKGEMLKLTWQMVDFERRLITFEALTTKTLKTRSVAMTSRLYAELRRLWVESDKNLEATVFGIKDNVRKSFSAACRAAGIKEGGLDGLTLHCLRHSAASRLVKAQMPVEMVGRILGHSQPQTTYRYLSANMETLYEAASILESLQGKVAE